MLQKSTIKQYLKCDYLNELKLFFLLREYIANLTKIKNKQASEFQLPLYTFIERLLNGVQNRGARVAIFRI